MSSERRRWFWIAIVAVTAAVWWLFPSPSQAPTVSEPPAAPRVSETSVSPSGSPEEPIAEDETPRSAPLPREEVELPGTDAGPDAGIAIVDHAELAQKRDEMLGVVLDRLKAERSAAEEAGDEELSAQLEIRIERLEKRRSELAEE